MEVTFWKKYHVWNVEIKMYEVSEVKMPLNTNFEGKSALRVIYIISINTYLCNIKLKNNINVVSKQINGCCNIFDRWYCSLIENILWASNIIFRVVHLLNLIYFELYTYLKLHNPHTHEIPVIWIAKKNNWVKYGYHQYDIIAAGY